jgi:hypothetical protein
MPGGRPGMRVRGEQLRPRPSLRWRQSGEPDMMTAQHLVWLLMATILGLVGPAARVYDPAS